MKNEVNLVGYVGKDAIVQTFDSGSKVSMFTVATTKTWQDKDGNEQSKTQWHNVAAWKYLANVTIQKGMMVYVEGELTYRKYTDKDNVERIHTEIIATKLYEIKRQIRDTIPSPTESDIPPLRGATDRMNTGLTGSEEVDDLPF